jgi:chromosome segregation ATPase
VQESTKTQISSLSAATTSLLEERMQGLNQQLTDIKGATDSTSAAVKQTRALAQRQSTELTNKLEDQQKQVADQLAQLKDATTTADTKISEVSSDVSNVKTDVNGVRTDVNGVRTDVNSVKSDVISTQAGLEKAIADLKRTMGDMGVMSGLIATNSKDLSALRELGERNYFEFDLSKKEGQKKIGNVTIAFRKSDPGRNRYSVDVMADDKRVEKKDRTINEPVQLYVNGNRQPYEIVVNQVKRDEIVGYLATPKVTLARQ